MLSLATAAIFSFLALMHSSALILRAIGDFRLVGFFKRVHGSPFARADTLLYSPLCLALGAALALLAAG